MQLDEAVTHRHSHRQLAVDSTKTILTLPTTGLYDV